MERLYEIHSSGRYDLIVVDTPPTRNAIDFLEAPARMSEFFGSRLLKWLTLPYRVGGRRGTRVLNVASRPFYQVADRILGSKFLEDIAEFFLNFQSMYDGFVARSKAVERLLHDKRTTFAVVTTLEAAPLHEAERFCEALIARDYHLGALVLNKTLPDSLRDPDGAAQVTSSLQLTWRPPAPVAEALALNTAVVPAVPAPAVAAAPPPPVMAPAPPAQAAAPAQPPMVVASATPTADVPSPSPTPAELTAMQVAADIRRAQELLATGDVKAARVLLMRAAESHDARAALALAKTFDPAVSRQSSLADKGGPDLVQARNWYQRAREWGSPEAQRLLDALASYQR